MNTSRVELDLLKKVNDLILLPCGASGSYTNVCY